MKYLIISILCYLVSLHTYAQTPVWAQKLGGSQADEVNGTALMPNGDIVHCGIFRGVGSFGTIGNSQILFSKGASDCFLMRQSSDGILRWVVGFGGTLDDDANGVQIDASGNLYVVGNFLDSITFEGNNINPIRLVSNGGRDAFVCKFDSNGKALWARAYGGRFPAQPFRDFGYTVDVVGSKLTVGGAVGDTVHIQGFSNTVVTSGSTPFVVQYDTAGNYLWHHFFSATAGQNSGAVRSLVMDEQYIWITGSFRGNAAWTNGGDTISSIFGNSGSSIFIIKATSSGSHVWTQKAFCRSTAIGRGLAKGNVGDVFMVGRYRDSLIYYDKQNNPTTIYSAGVVDITLARFTANGELSWCRTDGGAGNDVGIHAASINGNLLYTAYFQETARFGGLQPSFAVYNSKGLSDVVVCAYDTSGNYIWSRAFGSTLEDIAYGLVFDPVLNRFYVSGYFLGTIQFASGISISALPSTVRDGFLAAYQLPLSRTDFSIRQAPSALFFPNPSSEPPIFSQSGKLKVLSKEGNCMAVAIIKSGQPYLLPKLHNGVYFLYIDGEFAGRWLKN